MRTRHFIFALCIGTAACVSGPTSDQGVGQVEIRTPREPDVDLSLLKDGLENHPPKGIIFREVANYEPLALEFDRQRIETYLRRNGYYGAKVADIAVDESTDRVHIRFKVDLGPKSKLTDIDIRGAPAEAEASAEALRLCALLEVGEAIDYDRFLEAERRITARLNNQGYAWAKVRPRLQVERESGDAIAHFEVEPGPFTFFGRATTSTDTDLPLSFVHNRVAWQEGDDFSPSDLELTRARLIRSGLVDDVRFVRRESGSRKVMDVEIKVARGKPREFRVGAGVGLQQSFYEVRGRIGYRHKSFFDPLTTINLEARPAYAIFNNVEQPGKFNWEARATAEREDFIWSRVTGSVGLEFERIQRDAYTTTGPGVQVGLGRAFFDDRLTTSVGVHLERKSFSNVQFALNEDELRDIGLIDPLMVSYLSPTVAYDGRDDGLAPRSGYYARLSTDLGYVLTGKQSTFLTITPELRGYLPIGARVVLAARTKFGFAALGLRPLPITHRYFGGGADGHRGFGRRRLAPSAPATSGDRLPAGGEMQLLTSLEARVDLFKILEQQFGMVAFVDVGDVVNGFSELELQRLHVAVGPGARLTTPVGVVRLDVGFRVNRQNALDPDPDSPFAFHLSLGEAF